MIQAFYQTKPERDTPYRKLSLDYDEEKGWRVLLKSGTKWGPDNSTFESERSV